MPDSERIDPQTLRRMLCDGGELALVDVREGGPFSRSHLLVASNIPISQLEIRAPALLPRRTARIVLTDDGEGLAEQAAAVLAADGYSALSVLDGGVSAWGAAGFELFSGTGVPSKAFGEFVEHRCETPRIAPELLQQWRVQLPIFDEQFGRATVATSSEGHDRPLYLPCAMLDQILERGDQISEGRSGRHGETDDDSHGDQTQT